MAQETKCEKRLILEQEERYYSCNLPEIRKVYLRIIQPSKPHGGWSGNSRTLRVWSKLPPEESSYDKCTKDEILHLERILGEIENINFIEHPTLGLVAYERK